MIKSLTAREVFRHCPEVKKQLWGGEFWMDGYFADTVGKHGNEDTIAKSYNVKITRIAYGIPFGVSLGYIDKTTLGKAIVGRSQF